MTKVLEHLKNRLTLWTTKIVILSIYDLNDHTIEGNFDNRDFSNFDFSDYLSYMNGQNENKYFFENLIYKIILQTDKNLYLEISYPTLLEDDWFKFDNTITEKYYYKNLVTIFERG